MKNRLVQKSKRLLSGIVATAIAASMLPTHPAMAEETTEKYSYTLFAGSSVEGAITVNAGNFCMNGNVATNGTIVSSGNMNINGTKAENANESMIFIFDKIDSQYFSTNNVEEFTEDYTLEEINININTPTEVMGETTLTGNININTALKSLEDVNLYGEVKNTNDSVIFSKYGDIIIDSQNVNLNGLVYAPFGDVEVTAQNLNLNNVVIIADTITLNCPNVNANYSGNAAEFVGTVSEPLDIPVDEWQYMKDENLNDFPDFFESSKNWSSLVDTDGDQLSDCIEQYVGTNPELVDTDGDLLDDYYEFYVTFTDPTMTDTDENGVLDDNEDFDQDGLTNYEEYIQNTNPLVADSDCDGMNDGNEINLCHTNPLSPDTDGDKLKDGDENYLGTDPINPDTNGNGILDGDEKFYQTFTHIVENEDCAVEKVIVSMEGTGNLQRNTTVSSIMDIDMMCTYVVGLVGEPFSIETRSEFDTAILTFKLDVTKLGDTEFDNLLFLWYDEENDQFVELETTRNAEEQTVSVETTHFSKYMLVDQEEWFDAWKNAPDYFDSGEYVPFDTVICIDCSGSMSSNDPYFTYYYTPTHQQSSARIVNYRTLAVEQYIESMRTGDKTAIINYENSAYLKCDLTSSKSTLRSALSTYNGGGTNAKTAVEKALDLLNSQTNENNKSIILLSDGDVNLTVENIRAAKADGIKIYTVGLGDGANSTSLENIAKDTGGIFYVAKTAEELENIYNDISLKQFQQIEWEDNDEDGIPDEFEASGLICSNGKIYYTEHQDIETGKDTDGDGLTDGEEILLLFQSKYTPDFCGPLSMNDYTMYFKMRSNPMLVDTDCDGLNDFYDDEPNNEYIYYTLGSEAYLANLESRTEIETDCYIYLNNYYQLYCGYKFELMMSDYDEYIAHSDVNDISKSDWDAFCTTFKNSVYGYGAVTQAAHYFRNKLNRAPSTLDGLLSEKSQWDLLEVGESIYHMYNIDGEFNIKFVATNGMYEAVYNKDDILLTEDNDPINMGTFNYCSPNYWLGHFLFDMEPYYLWGNTATCTESHIFSDGKSRYENNDEAIAHREAIEARYYS